ncbi:Retrovirus-related Pol polyprotein from transposon TNT 1-94 [Gossypium australe]|uniref:Retrovirus-related Pol polyprotein from transposon TNT 1-94 n=1 Tax=Gossypium australe TaxID=47621 RepID=A0A5B6VEG5_9ROSI|nr:Retrovirus-related Pol polyprotein from transposon TNT 1-94 [Gossypium australe]
MNNAFLNGKLLEEVYMKQPPRFEVCDSEVCNLKKKSLYGLKQALRVWFDTLKNFLTDVLGFQSCKDNSSLFFKKPQLDVNRGVSGMHVSQQKYVHELLEWENMSNAKLVATPMICIPTLSSLTGIKLSDGTLYRQIIDGLQYLYLTRSDISFAVNKVSQYMYSPHDEHWCAVKRILIYVKGTTDFGLKFQPSTVTLTGYSDANWASSLEDRKSTFGYCVYFGANLVGWPSKKQTVVSHSTIEAEYRSLPNATSKLAWFQSLLIEIGVMSTGVPTIWCDNVSVVSLAANPVLHARAKYIEIDLHFVCDRVLRSQLQVNFVLENDQVADILTKPLSTGSFQRFRDQLSVIALTDFEKKNREDVR